MNALLHGFAAIFGFFEYGRLVYEGGWKLIKLENTYLKPLGGNGMGKLKKRG